MDKVTCLYYSVDFYFIFNFEISIFGYYVIASGFKINVQTGHSIFTGGFRVGFSAGF